MCLTTGAGQIFDPVGGWPETRMGKLRRLKHMILIKVMHAMYLMALAVMVISRSVNSKYWFYWRPESVTHPPQLHTII